jgi:hypothetical protein
MSRVLRPKRLAGLVWAIAAGVILSSGPGLLLPSQPTLAQAGISPQKIADQVYQRLPGFPLENQYFRQSNNQVATDSTLVERMIQYHTSVKGRSPLFRLDWKITLADYLGLNEYLQADSYPGKNFLKSNPMVGDRSTVQKLTRQQRADLIQAIVIAYTGENSQVAAPSPTLTPTPISTPALKPTLQPLPSNGGAQLLAPTPSLQPPRPTGEAQLLMP